MLFINVQLYQSVINLNLFLGITSYLPNTHPYTHKCHYKPNVFNPIYSHTIYIHVYLYIHMYLHPTSEPMSAACSGSGPGTGCASPVPRRRSRWRSAPPATAAPPRASARGPTTRPS